MVDPDIKIGSAEATTVICLLALGHQLVGLQVGLGLGLAKAVKHCLSGAPQMSLKEGWAS
jgi:hypothetical protein